jgi:hypothetical protein
LAVHWSRLDKGYAIEYCRVKCETVWGATRTGKPIEIELAERAITGEYRQGYQIVGIWANFSAHYRTGRKMGRIGIGLAVRGGIFKVEYSASLATSCGTDII